MKSISTILVIVLLIIIIVGIVALSYTFFTSLFTTTTGAAQNTTIHQVEQLRTQVRIVSTVTNGVVVRNTGLNDVTELDVMVNEKIVDHTLEPPVIGPDEVGTVKILDYIKEDDEVEIMTGLGTVSVESPNPCDEAVLCLDFDENSGDTVYDKSDYSNDGTIIDNEGDQWTVGKYGSALSFDGVDDYVSCGNDSSLQITNAITISAWVRYEGPGSGNPVIVMKGGAGGGAYDVYTQGRRVIWYIRNSSDGVFYIYRNALLETNNWVHVAATYDSSDGSMKIYKNGIEQTPTDSFGTPSGNIKTNIYGVGIGAWFTGTSNNFNGTIDRVRIYNKVIY